MRLRARTHMHPDVYTHVSECLHERMHVLLCLHWCMCQEKFLALYHIHNVPLSAFTCPSVYMITP